jgi:hypothetical protein
MPNKVLEQFPWLGTDPIRVSGRDIPRPKTIWELKDHRLRPVYAGLFLNWLASRGDKRNAAAVRVLLACWDAGLDYQQGTVPPGKGATWQKLTPFVTRTPMGTWDAAREQISGAAGLYAGDFYKALGQLKDCVRDNKADAEAAAKGFLAKAVESGGAADIVAMIAAMGPAKKQINTGINKLAILADSRYIGTPWKDYQDVIENSVGSALLSYGKAEGDLRKAVGDYQKAPSKPGEAAFEALVQNVAAYNKAAQELGGSVQVAAAAAAKFMADTAEKIAADNLAKVLPDVAEGLLVFDTCMYLFIGMLSAASPACPPLAIAATAFTVFQKIIDKAVVSIKTSSYLKDNQALVNKLLQVRPEKGSTAEKVTDFLTEKFDQEQLAEGIANTVFTISDKVISDPSAGKVQEFLSKASDGWQAYSAATAMSTSVVGVIVGGFEMSRQFANYDPTPFEVENSEKISKGLDEIKRLSQQQGLSSGSYVIQDRLGNGVYKAMVGGVAGTLDVLTQQFTPEDFQASFKVFADKAKTSATRDYPAGSGADTYQVTITSAIDLGGAQRERYEVRDARLVLTASIRHVVTKVVDKDVDAEKLPGTYYAEETAEVYLSSDGSLARVEDQAVPVLAAPAPWLRDLLYIPLRYRYPVLNERRVLDKNHPYLRLGYATFEDKSKGRAPMEVVLHTEKKMPAAEKADFDNWRLAAMQALEKQWKAL